MINFGFLVDHITMNLKNGDLFDVGRQNFSLQSVSSASSKKTFFDFVQK